MVHNYNETKESLKGVFGSIGCFLLVLIIFDAIVTKRIYELIIIHFTFFGTLKLIDLFILPNFSEKNRKIINTFFERNLTVTIVLTFSILLGIYYRERINDGLTTVDALTFKLYERSKYKFSGTICNDGFISHSQGQGSCSWHDGVKKRFKKGDYSKSIEECYVEAKKISWMDGF
jgi:hypothetical protein